jgi:DNA polymerase/3'-5' exonuclease PolX
MVEDISRVMMLETLSLGTTKYLGLIKNKNGDTTNNTTSAKWRHLDMRFVNAESFPYAWMYYSSGKIFNKMIREKLKKKGYKLNEWGLYHSNSNKKVDLGEDISKYINISLDTKTKCDARLKDEDLIEYKDVIEKKIFEKAGMEYKNVKERY